MNQNILILLCIVAVCAAIPYQPKVKCDPPGTRCGPGSDCCSNLCQKNSQGIQVCTSRTAANSEVIPQQLKAKCYAPGTVCSPAVDCCTNRCTQNSEGILVCAAPTA